ncbi:MAG: MoxR family ATPase [Chlamydiales bacterium]|nr:MoxR family ATPase [Chlamydiales bacterium]
MATDVRDITDEVKRSNGPLLRAKEAMAKVIVGQEHLLDRMMMALLTDGHLLLEGVPGLAKTLAITTLSKVTSCEHKRIQFTPDLLPADLIGTNIYNPKEGTFTIKKGPLFTNIVLADEINRAPGKVQSALLEVMQERQVTIGGETFKTGTPYLVVATQNPIEQEGTYPLPEAQTDRFMMKVKLDYPTMGEEKEILRRWARIGVTPDATPVLSPEDILKARQIVNQIYVDDKIVDYILNIVFSTRDPAEFGVPIEGLLEFGASPRASMALKLCGQASAFLAGRGYVTPHDIKSICADVLRHRVRLSYEAEAEELDVDDVIDRILDTIAVP